MLGRVRRPSRLLAALTATVVLTGCTSSEGRPLSPGPSPQQLDPGNLDGTSTPVADPLYPAYGNPAIDVLHYGLELAWAPQTKTLTGKATVKLRVLRAEPSLRLDLTGPYTVTSATLDGAEATARVGGRQADRRPVADRGRHDHPRRGVHGDAGAGADAVAPRRTRSRSG